MIISKHLSNFHPLKLGKDYRNVDPAGLEFSGTPERTQIGQRNPNSGRPPGRYSTTDSRFFQVPCSKFVGVPFVVARNAPKGPFYSRGFGVGFWGYLNTKPNRVFGALLGCPRKLVNG